MLDDGVPVALPQHAHNIARPIDDHREQPEDVAAEVRDAIAQTGGRGHIVTTGCVTPVDAPEANIRAAIAAAREA